METKPLCQVCEKKPCAVNYVKKGVVHYRSRCHSCSDKDIKITPRWSRAGYKKKNHCEKCGFRSAYKEQTSVFHIDGNRNNNLPNNLKTICRNCEIEVQKEGWVQGDLVPDF
jgi:hypothetical protein